MSSNPWSTTTKIVVGSVLGLLAALLLYAFRVMIQPTIIAFLLTFVLYQPVSWVQQRTGWSRATSIVSVYLLLIVVLIATPVIFVPRVVSSFEDLLVLLETLVIDMQTAAPGPALTLFGYELSANNLLQQLGTVIQNLLSQAGTGALGLAATLTTGILTTIYVLVLGFWLLKDIIKLQRMVMNALPQEYRDDFQRVSQELGEIWMAFLRGQLVLGLVIGAVTWIVMGILGLPNAAALALLAGLLEFLPTVGPGISGTIGTLVAVFQGSTWLPIGKIPFAIIVLIFYVIITQVESVYLIPRLVGRRVRLHPAVTFTGIISAALVFGVLGVLLITPTIASVRILLGYTFRRLRDLEPFESAQQQSEVQIPGLIAGHWIEGIVFDLDGTLTDLDWSLAGELSKRCQRLEKIWPGERREQFFRRLMAWMEGPSIAVISLLTWLRLHDDARRLTPWLQRVRAFPSSESQSLREGVLELLSELRQQYKVALITTRSRQEVDRFFSLNELPDDLFHAIVTRDDLRIPSPNSEGLLKLLEMLNLPADACLMVGDTELHLRVGEAVGAVQIGLLCGMGETQNFSSADLILDAPADLTAYLNRPQAMTRMWS